MKKQGMISKGINGLGLLIGFNQELNQGIGAARAGAFEDIPRAVIYGASGFNPHDGSFNQQQLITSVESKIIAVAWVKLAHYLHKHMRI